MKQLFFMLTALIVFRMTSAQTINLSQKEKDAVVYMREEEKMARDVYNFLYAKWNVNPFGNIRQSEQIHMERMRILILNHKLSDPVAENGDKPGVFSNSFLQEQYNQLIKSGGQSITEAFKAGAKIEELDIADLDKRLAQTTNAALRTQFNYLRQASENHLRAFTPRLKTEALNYQPVILEKEKFDKIISLPNSSR